MFKRSIVRLFESRKGHLDYRINRDYIRNGIATIPCRISDYYDVISRYSVKGNETLNPEFVDYVKTTAGVTPPECPIVLNVIGDCLLQEEKTKIDEIIRDDFAYDLGIVEKRNKRHTRIFIIFLAVLIAAGFLLWISKPLADVPRELIFIVFWFMGETICDYVFLTGHELRQDRRLAGRLASIKVVFSENYEEPEYTKSDVEKIYSEIEKDVNKTIS